MEIFKMRLFFSRFRRKAHAVQPDVEPVVDPKVQAYLDHLRDNGPQPLHALPVEEEEPMLALPWAA